MNRKERVLHALAIKKNASSEEVAPLAGVSVEDTATVLAWAEETGRTVAADGKYFLTPLARVALECNYSKHFAAVREDKAFMSAYEAFERINLQLKALITDWQTITVGGERIPNDHTNQDYDRSVIDRLGDLHEGADRILARLAQVVPRLDHYRKRLLEALERAEDGAIEWVSDARIESYHTVWFELHEDLLRIAGRRREE